jgi:hypothetical protein
LDPEVEVEYLLAAGRLDAAVERAKPVVAQPFLLIDALLQTARVRLRNGDRDAARAHALAAAAALPPFDRGDRTEEVATNSAVVNMGGSTDGQPSRNFGERSGDTQRRLHVIQLLAATGAVVEADALARMQLAGALRAVALSAAVAGRAGLRFDDQAPTLSVIEAQDL